MDGLRIGISKTELRILIALAGVETLSLTELAEKLGSPKSLVSKTLTKLMRREVISQVVSLPSKRKKFRISDWFAPAFRLLMTRQSHIPFERILQGRTLDVLWVIRSTAWDPRLLGKTFPKATLARTVSRLKTFGIIGRLNRLKPYSINIPELNAVVDALGAHEMGLIAKSLEPGAAIAAFDKTNTEFIVSSNLALEKPGFLMTGLDRFPEFDVKVATPGVTYYYLYGRQKALKAEEVLVHALVLGREDTRTLTYCLILFEKLRLAKKLDLGLLEKEAGRWHVEETVQGLKEYLESKGEKGPAIPWGEFQAKLRVYVK